MRRILFNGLAICSLLFFAVSCTTTTQEACSPSGNIKVSVGICPETGGLYYQVSSVKDGVATEAIKPSPLGIAYDNEDFSSNLTLKGFSKPTTVTDQYTLTTGKTRAIKAVGTEFTVTAANANEKEIQVRFRVYDDGAAFQYILPGEGEVTIQSEATGFAVPTNGQAWIHPYDKVNDWAPGYETPCEVAIPVGQNAPEELNGWSFPMLFNTNGLWILISEAGVEAFTYGGTHINPDCADGLYTIRFAEADEARGSCGNLPQVQLPFATNWRAIICGPCPSTVVESNLITTLNPKTPYTDLDWIKPGIASWSWWSAPDSPQNYNEMLPFIDMASNLGWEYFLVDANWNMMKNGNLKKVIEYAATKNVGVLVWYNSGGPHNVVTEAPRDKMLDPEVRKNEMKWLAEIGVKGLKVDFFQSDKPCIMQQYEGILHDAMEAHLLINFHGCTMPKGWQRTYPNMMTSEAIMGAECYAFNKNYPAQAPVLNTIIPYSRNVVGSVDYTPTTFIDHKFPHLTTNAHELALAVLFESGIVHIADHYKGIEATPCYVKAFLSEFPAVWDETKLLSGFPGKDVVLARRLGDVWYVAGVNGENTAKELSFEMPFLDKETAMNLIADGAAEREFSQTEAQQSAKPAVKVNVLPYGGFVATFK